MLSNSKNCFQKTSSISTSENEDSSKKNTNPKGNSDDLNTNNTNKYSKSNIYFRSKMNINKEKLQSYKTYCELLGLN